MDAHGDRHGVDMDWPCHGSELAMNKDFRLDFMDIKLLSPAHSSLWRLGIDLFGQLGSSLTFTSPASIVAPWLRGSEHPHANGLPSLQIDILILAEPTCMRYPSRH